MVAVKNTNKRAYLSLCNRRGGEGGKLSPCVTGPSADCCHNTCTLHSRHSMYVHIECIVCGLNFCPARSFNPFFSFAIVVV